MYFFCSWGLGAELSWWRGPWSVRRKGLIPGARVSLVGYIPEVFTRVPPTRLRPNQLGLVPGYPRVFRTMDGARACLVGYIPEYSPRTYPSTTTPTSLVPGYLRPYALLLYTRLELCNQLWPFGVIICDPFRPVIAVIYRLC